MLGYCKSQSETYLGKFIRQIQTLLLKNIRSVLLFFQNMFYIAVVKHAIIRHLVIMFMTRIVNDIFLKAEKRIYKPMYIYIFSSRSI